jgi:DNA-binding MarR family transcriptional regulator
MSNDSNNNPIQSDEFVKTETIISNEIQHLLDFVHGLKQNSERLVNYKAGSDPAPEPLQLAENMKRLQQIKELHLGEELSALGEPAWKILLQLIIATEERRSTTVADISSRISLTEPIALRYVNILENKGYIVRSQLPSGQSNGPLHLTKQGRVMMQETLLAIHKI